jgi:hypothetical protein
MDTTSRSPIHSSRRPTRRDEEPLKNRVVTPQHGLTTCRLLRVPDLAQAFVISAGRLANKQCLNQHVALLITKTVASMAWSSAASAPEQPEQKLRRQQTSGLCVIMQPTLANAITSGAATTYVRLGGKPDPDQPMLLARPPGPSKPRRTSSAPAF